MIANRLQRYYKKCTCAREHDEFLQKKNSFFIISRNMPIMLAWNRRIETDDKCASIEEINSRDCLAQNFSFFSEGTHPAGEGACRKNAQTRVYGVWAALSERSFGGMPVGQAASEGTTFFESSKRFWGFYRVWRKYLPRTSTDMHGNTVYKSKYVNTSKNMFCSASRTNNDMLQLRARIEKRSLVWYQKSSTYVVVTVW